ncbi:hypothetical protein Tco_0017973 [Tanacetum coccineum]
MSTNTKFANHKVDETNDLLKPVTSNSVPTPQESTSVKHDNVIAPRMYRINSLSLLGKKRVDNLDKTRRPQPRSNTKNDRVPSASKSSCNKNKEVEVEVHPRNLLLSKNKKHMSSELGSKERLASPKPKKPRTCLRWSPIGRIFYLKGKIIESSESKSQSDCSNGDNACTPNPQEPTSKRFPNSTFSLEGHSNLFMVRRLGMLKAHDKKSEASHKFRLEVLGNRPLWK